MLRRLGGQLPGAAGSAAAKAARVALAARLGGGGGGAAASAATTTTGVRRRAASAASEEAAGEEPPQQQQQQHRARVLSLLRAILREARGMPTENRRRYVEKRARAEFREGSEAATPGEADFLVRLAETQLENCAVQRTLLAELKRKGQLKS
jgi:hypothetical protein